MKIISKILLIFALILSSWYSVNASFFNELMWNDWTAKVNVDCWEEECDINWWINIVKDSVNWIETERTFSEYVQDIVAYVLGFITIIAVIYIIYAWFRILTGGWNEETLKKQKSTILYVAIWIAVIWLAYPIVTFLMSVLNS
jgi:hypothetical protein